MNTSEKIAIPESQLASGGNFSPEESIAEIVDKKFEAMKGPAIEEIESEYKSFIEGLNIMLADKSQQGNWEKLRKEMEIAERNKDMAIKALNGEITPADFRDMPTESIN